MSFGNCPGASNSGCRRYRVSRSSPHDNSGRQMTAAVLCVCDEATSARALDEDWRHPSCAWKSSKIAKRGCSRRDRLHLSEWRHAAILKEPPPRERVEGRGRRHWMDSRYAPRPPRQAQPVHVNTPLRMSMVRDRPRASRGGPRSARRVAALTRGSRSLLIAIAERRRSAVKGSYARNGSARISCVHGARGPCARSPRMSSLCTVRDDRVVLCIARTDVTAAPLSCVTESILDPTDDGRPIDDMFG